MRWDGGLFMALKPLNVYILRSICSSVPYLPYDVQSALKSELLDSLWAFLWCLSPRWPTAQQMWLSPVVREGVFSVLGALRPQVETSIA